MTGITYATHLDKYLTKKDGTSALYFRVTANRKTKLIPLYKYIKAEHYDFDKRKVKEVKSVPNARNLNTFLMKKKLLLEEIIIELENQNQSVSLDKVKNIFLNKNNKGFVNFCKKEVEKELSLQEIKLSTYNSILNRLRNITNFNKNVSLNEINSEWIASYKSFLISKDCKPNTIGLTTKSRTFFLRPMQHFSIC